MNQIKTGQLIRTLRQSHGLTQLALAQKIGVSDKAVSKWERGCGAPDLSLLPALAEALGVDADALLRGDLEPNARTNGNLKKLNFYLCPACGNLLFSTDAGEVSCCGRKLSPIRPQSPDDAHQLDAAYRDGEWFLSSRHEMTRDHFITFAALLNGDTLVLRKFYPQWGLETQLPFPPRGILLWHCSRHGLFRRDL